MIFSCIVHVTSNIPWTTLLEINLTYLILSFHNAQCGKLSKVEKYTYPDPLPKPGYLLWMYSDRPLFSLCYISLDIEEVCCV